MSPIQTLVKCVHNTSSPSYWFLFMIIMIIVIMIMVITVKTFFYYCPTLAVHHALSMCTRSASTCTHNDHYRYQYTLVQLEAYHLICCIIELLGMWLSFHIMTQPSSCTSGSTKHHFTTNREILTTITIQPSKRAISRFELI